MVLFPILAAITLLGIGYVLISLKKEPSQTEDMPFSPAKPAVVTPQSMIQIGGPGSRTSLFSKIFKPKKISENHNAIEFSAPKTARTSLIAKLFKKKNSGNTASVAPQRRSIILTLKDSLSKMKLPRKDPKESGNKYSTLNNALSINTVQAVIPEPLIRPTQPNIPEKISTEEAEQIRQDVRRSSELQELQEKYDKLDAIFNEKSRLLQETEEKLQSEIQNRKDYTKVKDIIEGELTETKSKLKNAHNEIKILTEEINIFKYTQNKPPDNIQIDPVSSLENGFTQAPKLEKTETPLAVSEEPAANEPPAPPKRDEEDGNEPQKNEHQDPPGFLSLKPDIADDDPDNNNNLTTKE